MKKSFGAMALLGACAGVAQAQSAVVIYGNLDAGVAKRTGTTVAVGKRDNNRLGFRGTEDLGDGLKALFQLEIRYEPDTGTIENTSGVNSRPLFQGQSRVGLQGGFGTARLGRGLTAYQETSIGFEPWSGMPTPAGFQGDLQVAGYTSDPLSPVGNSANRWSNAFFYNSPVLAGFQLNLTVASKEANGGPAIQGRALSGTPPQIGANSAALVVPYSVSATYALGPVTGMAAYERNGIDTKLWSLGAAFTPVSALKLMATYQRQDQDRTALFNPDTKSWVIGANYTLGPGRLLTGYGQKRPDAIVKTKQVSIGYEYNLSKRTYVYVDASHRRQPVAPVTVSSPATSLNFYGLGLHHNF